MFKLFRNFLIALLLTFSFSSIVRSETVIRVVDWQSGVGGITNAYADFIEKFEADHPGTKVEYTQYTVTTYNEFLKDINAQLPDIDLTPLSRS